MIAIDQGGGGIPQNERNSHLIPVAREEYLHQEIHNLLRAAFSES